MYYLLELLPFFKFRLTSGHVIAASSSSIMRCLRRPRTLVLDDFFCRVSRAHTENVADSSYTARNDGRLVSNKWKNLFMLHDQYACHHTNMWKSYFVRKSNAAVWLCSLSKNVNLVTTGIFCFFSNACAS